MFTKEDVMALAAGDHLNSEPRPLSEYPDAGRFVYYAQSGRYVKIGCSKHPELRVAQLANRSSDTVHPSEWGSDVDLIAYEAGDEASEAAMHAKFSHLHDRGEWFRIDDALAAHINSIHEAQTALEEARHAAHYEAQVQAGIWPDLRTAA